MWTDREFQTLSVCAFLNKFSHRLHHQSKLHFRVSLLLLHEAHTKWVISSGMSFLSFYILLFYLHVHLTMALHNHVCICYWFTVFPSEQVKGQGYTTPKTLDVQPMLCFPVWSLFPLTFLCLNILQNLWSRNNGERAQYTQKFIYVFKNLLLFTKKNYDTELQSGRMFLTHQMVAIPTFMPSGRFKTNISLPLKLIYKKMHKMNRQWAVYINTWCERFHTHIQILLLCVKVLPPPQKHRGKQWYTLLFSNFGSSQLHTPATLSLEKKPLVSTEGETWWVHQVSYRAFLAFFFR
jgi:hypothetical protein